MAIIDHTIFTDIITLQSSRASEQANITAYANLYEPLYLKHLLGSEMYYAFEAGKTGGVYKKLIDGDSEVFEWNGQFYKFDGIKRMLGCLIYPHIIELMNRGSSTIGVVEQNVETAINKLPNKEMLRARNEGVRLSKVLQAYILYKSASYPLYEGKCLSTFPEL
jgi:hypothetical protein